MIRWKNLSSALMVSALLVLAPACSAQTPELSVDAARQLQSRLPEVRQAAAGNDYSRALGLLEQLKKDLDEAAGDGKMTFARYQGISSALENVRNELQALADAAAQAARMTDVVSPTPGPSVTAFPEVATAPLPPATSQLTEESSSPEQEASEKGSVDKNDAGRSGGGKPDEGKPDPGGKNKDP